jgi:hypothetical protein
MWIKSCRERRYQGCRRDIPVKKESITRIESRNWPRSRANPHAGRVSSVAVRQGQTQNSQPVVAADGRSQNSWRARGLSGFGTIGDFKDASCGLALGHADSVGLAFGFYRTSPPVTFLD